jgi:hypothetical protein
VSSSLVSNMFCARLVGLKWEICEKEDPGARMFREIGNYNVHDLLNVLNFLLWYEKSDQTALWGGVRIVDALASLRCLLGFDEGQFDRLESIILGEEKSEDYAH